MASPYRRKLTSTATYPKLLPAAATLAAFVLVLALTLQVLLGILMLLNACTYSTVTGMVADASNAVAQTFYYWHGL